MVYKDPASLEAQHEAEDEIDSVTVAMTVSILAVIARRLGKLNGKTIAEVYASMPKDLESIEKVISRGSESIDKTTRDIFNKMADGNDKWSKRYYEAANVKQEGFANDPVLKGIAENGVDSALKDIKNIVNTSVIGIADEAGNFRPIRDAYIETVGRAANEMIAGNATLEDVVSEATKKLSKEGVKVKYPDYYERKITDKAGKVIRTEWTKREKPLYRELSSAVRTNVMDAYRTTMVDMRMEMGEQFGADGVEVSAHVPCAPDHEPYQGRQFPNQAWANLQSSLSRQLVYGANCHHTTYPVILGVSHAYSKEKISTMNKKSSENVTVKGLSGENLTMTRYEASQYQRRIEQSLRNANTERYLLSENAKDTKALEKAIKQRTREYKRISKEAGLPVRMDRTKVYTL